MNNYPPGFTPTAKKTTYEYQCINPECGHYWEAVGIEEFGIVNMINNNADLCPWCGCVGRELR
jgi:hypothetical protein